VISDGKEVTVYDPDLEQATIQKMGDQALTTPAILFSGDTKRIGELFDVELTRFDPSVRQFSLKPKGSDSLFERLKLRFIGSNVSELRITDALGQESTMSFIQTQINLKLPEDTFIVNLPEGTDVIRDVQVPAS
jgi:outer membrane lipoprotein carrier protein